jgi:hypothetical protein
MNKRALRVRNDNKITVEARQEIQFYLRGERLSQLVTFKPDVAMQIAIGAGKKDSDVLAVWSLCRLIAWAFYDQNDRKEVEKAENHPVLGHARRGKTKRAFTPLRAQSAGQLFLAHKLKEGLLGPKGLRPTAKIRDPEIRLCLDLLVAVGLTRARFGIRRASPEVWHNNDKRRHELKIVYSIVDALVWSGIEKGQNYLTASGAIKFVRRYPEFSSFRASRIARVWARYRASSPYIYAFFPIIYANELKRRRGSKSSTISFDQWIERIARCAAPGKLTDVLGIASYAAHVLSKTAIRDVRTKDFEGIPQCKPPRGPFWRKKRDEGQIDTTVIFSSVPAV